MSFVIVVIMGFLGWLLDDRRSRLPYLLAGIIFWMVAGWGIISAL